MGLAWQPLPRQLKWVTGRTDDAQPFKSWKATEQEGKGCAGQTLGPRLLLTSCIFPWNFFCTRCCVPSPRSHLPPHSAPWWQSVSPPPPPSPIVCLAEVVWSVFSGAGLDRKPRRGFPQQAHRCGEVPPPSPSAAETPRRL